jgi:hypothetical protein
MSFDLWQDIYPIKSFIYLFRFRFMPPKKRVTKQEEQLPAETSAKPTEKLGLVAESKK